MYLCLVLVSILYGLILLTLYNYSFYVCNYFSNFSLSIINMTLPAVSCLIQIEVISFFTNLLLFNNCVTKHVRSTLLAKLEMNSTVLLTISKMLYSRSLEIFILYYWNFISIEKHITSTFSHPLPALWWLPFYFYLAFHLAKCLRFT